jgi:hypothetical protein
MTILTTFVLTRIFYGPIIESPRAPFPVRCEEPDVKSSLELGTYALSSHVAEFLDPVSCSKALCGRLDGSYIPV